MFGEGAPARLAAIVDWEMGTVGDPKLDLAWMLHSWPEQPDATSSYVDMTGMPGRTQLLDRYVEVSGRQVDDIDYYVILAKWKMAIVLEQSFQRAPSGCGRDVLRRSRAVVELAAGNDHVGSGDGESRGDGRTKAPTAAGDHRYLAVESEGGCRIFPLRHAANPTIPGVDYL
jgi:hypothetical protein